jgi:hypothetical protein
MLSLCVELFFRDELCFMLCFCGDDRSLPPASASIIPLCGRVCVCDMFVCVVCVCVCYVFVFVCVEVHMCVAVVFMFVAYLLHFSFFAEASGQPPPQRKKNAASMPRT